MITMAKQDVIDALKYYGGRATQTEITAYLKSKNHSGYCSAVLQRLKAWHEVRLENVRNKDGHKVRRWVLNEDGY
jgi:7-cyano-7-deazaguanine synthase in queuosine biosynthesis